MDHHFGDAALFCHVDGTEHWHRADDVWTEEEDEDDEMVTPRFACAEDYPDDYNEGFARFIELDQQEMDLEARLRDARKRVWIAETLVRLHGDREKVRVEARKTSKEADRIKAELAAVTRK